MKKSSDSLIKIATLGICIGRWLMRAAGVNLVATLLVVGLTTITAVASVAKAKYGELVVAVDLDPTWWVLAGAFGVSMVAMWVALLIRFHPRRRRYHAAGKVALGVAMVALAAVVAVGDLDAVEVFQFMEAMI